jgi:beta-glucosidase/6-phospho-beta-glucosidase/beta-galactosidase
MGGRALLVAALVVLAGSFAGPSHASNAIRYGIQDDAWVEYGPGKLNDRVAILKRLGVPFVRFTVHWNAVATKRPSNPSSPRDRAYNWSRADRVLLSLRRHGLTPVVTLLGTPRWANGGRGPSYAPPHPRDFRAFAHAAAARYPWIRYWLIWNEPNHPLW